MIKSELIEKLAAENPHLTQAEVERLVNVVLGRMVETLSDGGRAEIRVSAPFPSDIAPHVRAATHAPAKRSMYPPRPCPSSRAARNCVSG